MKHIYLSLVLLFLSCAVSGQETMLGLTRNYNLGSGGVFRQSPGIQEVEINDLFSEPLFSSQGKFLLHSSGKIYAVSTFGGERSKGAIYSFDQNGENFKTEYHFGKDPEGLYPKGGLVEGTDGMIYGVLGSVQFRSEGSIYRFNPISKELTSIYDYSRLEASGTSASLIAGSDDWLYGTSPLGGESRAGTIFKVAQIGDTLEVLYEFSDSSVYGPSPFLTLRSDGWLYGYSLRRSDMGYRNIGRLFRMNAQTGQTEFLEDFPETVIPLGELLIGPNGNIYGVSETGGAYDEGMIFKTDSLGQRFVRLHSFGETGQSLHGASSLTMGNDLMLYGYCLGHTGSPGGLYKITTYGDGFQLVSNFQPTEDLSIKPHLLKVGDQFIGVMSSQYFWTYDQGHDVLFFLQTNGEDGYEGINTRLLADNGISPSSGLLLGTDSVVYGLTREGGANNLGVLFSMDYCGNNFQVILDFDDELRINHIESILEGPEGNLLASVEGGDFGRGKIVVISPESGFVRNLIHFDDPLFGGGNTRIIFHPNQNIYGVISRLSLINSDFVEIVIFRVDLDGADYSVEKKSLVDRYFTSLNGDLMVHSNGRIYGSLRQSVFEFDPVTRDFSFRTFALHEDEALNPLRMIEGPDHRLYGTGSGYVDIPLDATYYYYQFIWTMDPDTGAVSFHSQVPIWAKHPIIDGQLTVGPDHRLYGSAWIDNYPGLMADAYEGFVFSVDTTGALYEREIHFGPSVGNFPIGNVLFVPDGDCPPIEAPALQAEYATAEDRTNPGIYPNPVSEILYIITDAPNSGAVSIRDLQGRLLGTYPLDPQTGSTTIDMRPYASGTYLITISQGNTISTHKVVKW